jgi:hypothetical protein
VNSYVVKPIDFDSFVKTIADLGFTGSPSTARRYEHEYCPSQPAGHRRMHERS